jgi:polar amino acid transport system substrate-binding protein
MKRLEPNALLNERTTMVRLKLLGQVLSLLILICAPLADADVLDDILDRGSIRVGVAEFVPWTVRTRSGELIGFEIDVARKIASDMGVKPEFTVYEWEKIIPALQHGEIDVIAGGMEITPGRALQVNFSRPLATSGVTLATNTRKTQNIKSLKDLNKERVIITVVADTLALSVAQTFFDQATIKVYPTSELAEKDVLEARAHAYVASVPEVNFLALKNAGKIDVPMAEPIMASSEGLAVKKGEQELVNFLNSWVIARQTDKWLETARDYWFETMDWVPQASK